MSSRASQLGLTRSSSLNPPVGHRGPSVVLQVDLPRQINTAAEQIVLGLVTGALVGGPVAIRKRDANHILFDGCSSARGTVPDVGALNLTTLSSGETRVDCKLSCRRLRLRLLLRACLLGALIATVCSLLFGWLISLSIPTAIGVTAVSDQLAWRGARRRLRTRVETYLRNTVYLKVN